MALEIISGVSHLDHGASLGFLEWLKEKYKDKEGFFIDTFTIPGQFGMLECGLHGPIMGDEPISEHEVEYIVRNGRPNVSRVCKRSPRKVNVATVIAGPANGKECVLYTVYGGPLAPREPGDPTLPGGDKEKSEAFWGEHALSG